MPAYLLGTQALADAARNDDTPIHRWAAARELDEDDVVASVVSFMLLQHRIDALDQARRAPWQRLFNVALAKFRSCDGILPVRLEVALRAAELRGVDLPVTVAGRREPLGDLGVIVAANALEEHLTLVDRRHPYHATLEASHGLAFFDPYAR